MTIYEAFEYLRQGFVVRYKHSYYILQKGVLMKATKNGEILGVATLRGDAFAYDNWELWR